MTDEEREAAESPRGGPRQVASVSDGGNNNNRGGGDRRPRPVGGGGAGVEGKYYNHNTDSG